MNTENVHTCSIKQSNGEISDNFLYLYLYSYDININVKLSSKYIVIFPEKILIRIDISHYFCTFLGDFYAQ